MKRLFPIIALIAVTFSGMRVAVAADAPAPERSVQERLEDLEAYVNNGARNATTNAPTKIAGPGPGHNAWQMASSALVLFMTLPGLALFYGGLVRRKNVLSLVAQCFGIAGLAIPSGRSTLSSRTSTMSANAAASRARRSSSMVRPVTVAHNRGCRMLLKRKNPPQPVG